MFTTFKTEQPMARSVLAVVVAVRVAGYAVVDGFGLSRTGPVAPVGTWNLIGQRSDGARAERAVARLARVVRSHRPASIVLGFDARVPRSVVRRIVEFCRRHARSVTTDCRYAGLRALGWSTARPMRRIADDITRHFLPELAIEFLRYPRSRIRWSRPMWRYRRTAWQAAALALRGLALTRPLAAAALVRERPARTALIAEIERGAMLLRPARTI